MAELFGIDRERVEKLYLYYTIQNGVADSGTMTLPVFVDYVLNSVAANETYGSMVSASAIASLRSCKPIRIPIPFWRRAARPIWPR